MNTPAHHDEQAQPAHPASDVPPDIWTAERIRALGPVTDLATTARIFGLSRSLAYDLAKRNEFPIPVLRFGSNYRVPVAAILQALHLLTAADPKPADDDLISGGSHTSINPRRIHRLRLAPTKTGGTT
ncbi:DNA-binding protein [Micromonospora sp. WMMD1082]|uniref:DNA-binding protein n=1 Tax=Micromonospora sp. WMMD1082 TaxID=3016104 RepID=UPI00241754D7|nr:DNA-binding protein [Micromonospora sp. WMMD1082]MDG4795075.1 DNA-binding protein [Micromonospora sp. WMMD1082]